ncbi:hypothetical protein HYPSUDRAFT_38618 [Hypholoma sublateritium FD-334 SS-4]|uniref:DUF1742-domain-containing protein n=1 Tax=Hypholoma sublateritium (strain FD-334 SS-4) TaxID=945553 RepID=A0A0D2LBE3_HYPSF|nr:hypothetical protein HYPSUDRAFT_38618 [Hypholoma sublateritium FD-334 SS-4]
MYAETQRQTAGTAKACYVCFKPTTTVLATVNAADFLYTCPTHLSDPGFANIVPSEPSSSTISAEEIAKVKTEWEERQKKKLEREKAEKEKASDTDDDSKKKSNGQNEKATHASKSPQTPGSLGTTSPSPSPSLPKHDRYTLHRDFFDMRQSEHRKRRQAAQAKELAPRLPGAPMGSI